MNELEPREAEAFEHERARIQEMSDWLDRAVILATQLEHVQEPSESTQNIDIDFEQYVSELNMLFPHGLQVQFRGPGYTCVLDENGIPITVYRDEERPVVGSGELRGIKILDDTDVEYVCEACEIGQFYDEDDDAYPGADVAETYAHPEPSDLAQIFLEFETAKIDSQTDDLSLHGECVRTDKLRFYSLLEASSIQIEFITPITQVEQCQVKDVLSTMQSSAAKMRRLVRDTAFRRSSSDEQRQQIEDLLDEANQYLGLERFEATASFDLFYQKGFDEAELVFVETADGNRYFNPCIIQPLRLASLDLEKQPNKAIRNNKDLLSTDTSLYMVAEIDKYVQQQIGADSPIIWIPIMPTQRKIHTKKQQNPAAEIDLEFHPAGIDLSANDLY